MKQKGTKSHQLLLLIGHFIFLQENGWADFCEKTSEFSAYYETNFLKFSKENFRLEGIEGSNELKRVVLIEHGWKWKPNYRVSRSVRLQFLGYATPTSIEHE